MRSRAVLKAIRGHHERFDGAGYPDGLRGDKIPFLARILSLADCYDALTSVPLSPGPGAPGCTARGVGRLGHAVRSQTCPSFLDAIATAEQAHH